MWLTPNTSPNNIALQQQRQSHSPYSEQASRHSSFSQNITPTTAAFFNTIDPSTTLDVDSELTSLSAASSPQSVAGPFPLSTFDSVPAASVPRTVQNGLYKFSAPDAHSQLLPPVNMMYTDQWLGDNHHFTPRNNGRNSHQRDSSLSSLGSLGPASPFSFNTANPQIAMNEPGENYHGISLPDDQSYQLTAKAPNPTPHDTFYANFPYSSDSAVQAYASMLAPQKHRGDRAGLQPAPDFPSGGQSNSRPVSVASSIASDSPATPAAPEPEEDRSRKIGLPTVPKLDRTMTDIYSDELYNPNFTITSTAPSQPSHMAMSPTREMFAQRVQAANNQHLSATEPTTSSVSRGRSPFCHGSPLAPTPSDFAQSSVNHVHFNSAQQMREKKKAEMDAAQALRHVISQSHGTGTPQTISPKDALLEFNDGDDSNNFPLFPQTESTGFDASHLPKANSQASNYGGLSLDTSFDNYLASQVPTSMQQLPQQYPFVAKHRQQPSVSSVSNGSYSISSRFGSSAPASPDSTATGSPQRPDGVRAEGGTYTCTYHGCTQRFESPTALQKHKREGHRQAHGLNGLRRPEGPTGNFFNTQAGPHKCERINPSTGKPCNTVFSRPYDLTRHEDTIHNARKQKVRCDVCTEEKTFSRADALTRHYRVCHPDLEFPGKHRRRGGSST
ncbi:hypothetical protein VPNG_01218 [Cytospora leucostoma]|uniref:C2H2-type domain-containing protein n=1 Tax=Cytospora leucostoma TaxID=1230097 RepID=A0A423XKI3_9PEZI|nr:hypothetical protein VPNG_01218 [Cytospora leucostoma]